jgi:TRAP-type C4-dicarboxylate transport system substrate-binding protein
MLLAVPSAAETEWVMTSIAPEGSPAAEYVIHLARAIEKATGGLVRVRVRQGGMLGNENETLGMLSAGRIQVWGGSVGAVAPLVPALGVLETPYLLRGDDEIDRVTASDVLDRPLVSRAFRERGMVPLGIAFGGWRGIATSSRAVRFPQDLAGLRIRAQPSALHAAIWRRLGAVAVERGLTDVDTAFRAREVEGADLPLLFLFGTSASEHVRYYLQTKHIAQSLTALISRTALEKLPARARRGIFELRLPLARLGNTIHRKLEGELLAALRDKGVKVITPSAEELRLWKEALAPLREEALELGGPAGQALLRDVELIRAGRR